MKGSGFTIVTILKFSTLWTEESFFSLHMSADTVSNATFTIAQIHFLTFIVQKKKKSKYYRVQHAVETGLTYSQQSKPNSRDRAATEQRVTDPILTEHPPRDITRDTFKCLHYFNKTLADWLSKLPRNL